MTFGPTPFGYLDRRPLNSRTGIQYIIPQFLMHLITLSICFLHYTNGSTVALLRNSLFHINKQNIFAIVKKAPKMGDDVMKRVSEIIQCSMFRLLGKRSFGSVVVGQFAELPISKDQSSYPVYLGAHLYVF